MFDIGKQFPGPHPMKLESAWKCMTTERQIPLLGQKYIWNVSIAKRKCYQIIIIQ